MKCIKCGKKGKKYKGWKTKNGKQVVDKKNFCLMCKPMGWRVA